MILPFLAAALLLVATVYSAIVSFRPADGKPSWIFLPTTTWPKRIFVGSLGLALLIGVAFQLGMGTRSSSRHSSRFLIPDGYTGWVRVEFEVQGATPLPMEGAEYVLTIPPSGVLRTSAPEQYGWANDHYYYSSAAGMRSLTDSGPNQLIWGKLNGEEAGVSGKRKYEEFFVGTQQQFKDQAKLAN